MAEESADALIKFRADDVLEFAGLVVRFGVFDCKCVFEKALGQAMAPDDISGAPRAGFGQLHVTVKRLHQL
jgi:hypothetical protein